MNHEKYNLNWHTYSDHLREMLHNMMKTGNLTDVTLVCDEQRQFKAHKIVLSACSTVFKNIIDSLPLNSSEIYLKGIQHQEMESILDFMHFGVATFFQGRMKEFLNVAKNLEIKEISKDVGFKHSEECNGEEKDMTETASKEFNSETETDDSVKDQLTIETNQNIRRNLTCLQCNAQFTKKSTLNRHIKSIHEAITYSCSHCDKTFKQQGTMNRHIKSKHEGVKYICNQCDYQATLKFHLTIHIQSIHDGVKYACNECGHQATHQSSLTQHIRSKHEGFKYTCKHCSKEYSYQSRYKHLKTCKASRSHCSNVTRNTN